MTHYCLNMGDVAVNAGNATYTCYGLGTCIGLFLHDRVTGISGGAHILLPADADDPEGDHKFYDVASALNRMLEEFRRLGSSLDTLRAKIAGGANVLRSNSYNTGEKNTRQVMTMLIERKIFIAAADVGGTYSRTAVFTGNTGQLLVRVADTRQVKIY